MWIEVPAKIDENPSIDQGANCNIQSGRLDAMRHQCSNERLTYKLVDKYDFRNENMYSLNNIDAI